MFLLLTQLSSTLAFTYTYEDRTNVNIKYADSAYINTKIPNVLVSCEYIRDLEFILLRINYPVEAKLLCVLSAALLVLLAASARTWVIRINLLTLSLNCS